MAKKVKPEQAALETELADKLAQVAELPSLAGTIMPISLNNLVPNPDNPRYHDDPATIQTLAKSIQTYGLLNPLVVSGPTERTRVQREGVASTPYTVLCGNRRLAALQVLYATANKDGDMSQAEETRIVELIQNIPCLLYDGSRAELPIVENSLREALDPVLEARYVVDHVLSQDGDMEDRLMAATRSLGKSEAWIRQCIQIANAKSCVKELHVSRGLSREVLIYLAKLGPAEQEEATTTLEKVPAKDLPTNVVGIKKLLNFYSQPTLSFMPWPLDLALTDFPACNSCQFNTANQLTFDGGKDSDGKCLNRSCYDSKMEDWLSEWATDVADEYIKNVSDPLLYNLSVRYGDMQPDLEGLGYHMMYGKKVYEISLGPDMTTKPDEKYQHVGVIIKAEHHASYLGRIVYFRTRQEAMEQNKKNTKERSATTIKKVSRDDWAEAIRDRTMRIWDDVAHEELYKLMILQPTPYMDGINGPKIRQIIFMATEGYVQKVKELSPKIVSACGIPDNEYRVNYDPKTWHTPAYCELLHAMFSWELVTNAVEYDYEIENLVIATSLYEWLLPETVEKACKEAMVIASKRARAHVDQYLAPDDLEADTEPDPE